MDIVSTLLIAVALAMDAFSVSLTKGFTMPKISKMQILWFAIFFGGFQSLMPAIGYLAGMQLEWLISTFAPWAAFILLALIGTNMIRESFSDDDEESDKFSFKELILLAIATSIDALAIGVSLAFLGVDIWWPVLLIGLTTCLFSTLGVYIGNAFGCQYKSKAEFAGGAILCLMGIKILIEHIFV